MRRRGTRLLSCSPSCTSFSCEPQSLGFSEEAREQSLCEVEQIESICFRQRALMGSVVAILMDSGGQLSQGLRQLSVVEQPRKSHAKIPSGPTIDTCRPFWRQQRTGSQIQCHAKHGGRRVPASCGDTLCPFVEGASYRRRQKLRRLHAAHILQTYIAFHIEKFGYVIRNSTYILINVFRSPVSLIFYGKNSSAVAFSANGISFVVMLPPVFYEDEVESRDIERHALHAASRATRNNGGHSSYFRDCHSGARRVSHVFDVQAARQIASTLAFEPASSISTIQVLA